ncbi:YraN family protein [Alkaliphilus pronyensis]|uniref:UPF0102 protein F8154_02720 n=1 Tax=Alkaliphilus pronyensis TaxID=1482732 RepID=A0A6I0FDB0_9FIRM|nr:YraN family protein [Alkaliphilus pronyensis]KAB3537226.1 YraN family protein [Alkaliphilus pronyensis]
MKKKTGYIGEAVAKKFLLDKGYKILFQNYRTKFGEIDIVATIDNIVAFIEVKTRKTIAYGMPREAINYKKQMNYRRLADHFILSNPSIHNKDFRFDVIEVIITNEKKQIKHIKNAF